MLLQTTVKSFFARRNYGFLNNPHGGRDVYAKGDRLKVMEDGKLREWRPGERRPSLRPGQPVYYCARIVGDRPQAIVWGIVLQS